MIFSNAACPRIHTAKNTAGPRTTPPGAKYHPNHASERATSVSWVEANEGAQVVRVAEETMALDTFDLWPLRLERDVDGVGVEAWARAVTTLIPLARQLPRLTTRGNTVVDAKVDISRFRSKRGVVCKVVRDSERGKTRTSELLKDNRGFALALQLVALSLRTLGTRMHTLVFNT